MKDSKDIRHFIDDMYLLAQVLKTIGDEESIEILSRYYMQYEKEHIILMWFMTILLLDDMTDDAMYDTLQ